MNAIVLWHTLYGKLRGLKFHIHTSPDTHLHAMAQTQQCEKS